MAKTGNCVKREAQHFAQGIFRGTSKALMALVLYCLLAKAHPHRESAHKTVLLTHRHQAFDHLAIKQTKIPGIAGNIDRGNPLNQTIECGGGPEFEACLA